ncbi:WD40-repeat-containing domain protein [Schizophyllum amplum]|uniref:WD40-repeat-containing domain protein n=1 Tax=Schizophyllum amplum TaxID=97359 RepID=A0A550CL89_9AGAR|nr:WD40-repeat-containing domain protein [Auriculariopsis ampla]
MSFPHTHLLPGSSRTICVSGPHISVLDTERPRRVNCRARRSDKAKGGPIRVAAVDRSQKHLATSSDDKCLRVWELIKRGRELPKKATDVRFTQDGQTIIVADKFGDVFAYPLHPPAEKKDEGKKEKDGLASHENPSDGDLVLGHVSLLTACILTPDERYIITADRDEHIRVSWYPQAYQIESFCLGNEKFVSALHIPASAPDRLISGGGDPVLRVWDWMSGALVREIPVLDAVEPTIKVKSLKRKWGEGGEGTAPRKKKRKGKGKGKAAGENEVAEQATDKPSEEPQMEEEGKTVLVVHKIDSVGGEYGQPPYIVFSAVGATALYACPFAENAPAGVQAFDFGLPVLDFAVLADGRILVSLDFQWGDETLEARTATRCLQFTDGNVPHRSRHPPPVLATLNKACLHPATNAELDVLDLYSALASMPKFNLPVPEDEGDATPAPDTEQMTKRQMGRMKNKSAVLARKAAADGGVEEERESKRAKSDEGEGGADMMP